MLWADADPLPMYEEETGGARPPTPVGSITAWIRVEAPGCVQPHARRTDEGGWEHAKMRWAGTEGRGRSEHVPNEGPRSHSTQLVRWQGKQTPCTNIGKKNLKKIDGGSLAAWCTLSDCGQIVQSALPALPLGA